MGAPGQFLTIYPWKGDGFKTYLKYLRPRPAGFLGNAPSKIETHLLYGRRAVVVGGVPPYRAPD